MRRPARLLATLGLAVAASAPVGLAGAQAAAPTAVPGAVVSGSVPMSGCTSADVVVAVDFGHFGGPVVRGCGTVPTTGYQLVNQGGFSTTGTSHDGPGFVCRIASTSYAGGAAYPTAAQDPCVRTPPSSAYWSYWHAAPGATTWSYSTRGAMSAAPEAGSADLWTFGSTDTSGSGGSGQPRVTPAEVRAGATGSTGSGGSGPGAGSGGSGSTGGSGAAGGSTSGGSTSGGSTSGGTTSGGTTSRGTTSGSGSTPAPRSSTGTPPVSPSASAGATASPSSATTSAAAGGTASSSPTSGAPAMVNASGETRPSTGPDLASSGPAIVGLVVVLLVGGAAVTVARRRRRTDA